MYMTLTISGSSLAARAVTTSAAPSTGQLTPSSLPTMTPNATMSGRPKASVCNGDNPPSWCDLARATCTAMVCSPVGDPCYVSCKDPPDGAAIMGGVFCGLTLLSIVCAVWSFVRQRRRGDDTVTSEYSAQGMSTQTPATTAATELKNDTAMASKSGFPDTTTLDRTGDSHAYSAADHLMHRSQPNLPTYSDLIIPAPAAPMFHAITTSYNQPYQHSDHYHRLSSHSQKSRVWSSPLPTTSVELEPLPTAFAHARWEPDSRNRARGMTVASVSPIVPRMPLDDSIGMASTSHGEQEPSRSSVDVDVEDERMSTRAGPVPEWGV